MTSISSVPSTTGIAASSSASSGNNAQIAALEKQLQALQKQLKTAQKDTSGDSAEKIKLLQAQIAQIQAQHHPKPSKNLQPVGYRACAFPTCVPDEFV